MMFQKHRSLIINGQKFNAPELESISTEKTNSVPEKNWEHTLYQFILEWLNDSLEIHAQTSGTTGAPKNISISKEKMLHSAMMTIRHLQLQQNDTALLCLSCDYIAGKMMVARAFAGNLNLIPTEPLSNPLKSVNQNIDFAAFVPSQVYEILSDSETKKRLEQIRNVIIGGAPVSQELNEQISKLRNNVYETYGMTESISHVALKRLSSNAKHDDAGFFATLEGITISTDDRNCLVINAPHLSATPIITNDIVGMKDSRHFKWLGRLDNVVNSGGIKLIPESLEEKIMDLIERRYFFKGIPDEKLGEKLVLVIEGKTFSADELTRLKTGLSQKLGKFEVPKEIVFKPKFKMTASGKIQREL